MANNRQRTTRAAATPEDEDLLIDEEGNRMEQRVLGNVRR